MSDTDQNLSPKNFVKRSFQKGEYLFNEGNQGDMAYVIQKGRVEIIKGITGKSKLGIRSKGEVIGEMALFDDSARIASVIALEDTVVIGISRAAFQERLAAMDPSMQAIMKSLVSRLADLSTKAVMANDGKTW
jgi:CRP-like cAMP-binding protein